MGFDPLPGIGNRYPDANSILGVPVFVLGGIAGNGNFAAGRRKLNGIGQNVEYRLVDKYPVPVYHRTV